MTEEEIRNIHPTLLEMRFRLHCPEGLQPFFTEYLRRFKNLELDLRIAEEKIAKYEAAAKTLCGIIN